MKNRIRITLACWILTSHLFAQDTTALRFSRMITAESLRSHLSVLASDSLEGRGTGQMGMVKAANYVAQQFASYGMPPVSDNRYFQPLPLLDNAAGTFQLSSGSETFKPEEDFYVIDSPPVLHWETEEVVFAGYGIRDSAAAWNDYSGWDIAGKTIMIMEGEPVDRKGKSLITKTDSSSKWKNNRHAKIDLLTGAKAGAIIVVLNDYQSNFNRYKKWVEHGRLSLDNDTAANLIPLIYVSRHTADRLLGMSGTRLSDYEKNPARKKKNTFGLLKIPLKIHVELKRISCNNVLGYVEGGDLKDEVIVVSAHLDHLGKRGSDIYYGADDDGSGCASVLSMAEVFMKARREGKGPRRSILFITFSGEEKGLLGSEHYVNNPLFPLKNTVANLNIDMIGRVDTVTRPSAHYTYVIGSDKLSTELHSINESANGSCCMLQLDYRYNDPSDKLKLYYRSDHYNFAKNRIPVIFYFTGLHADYHKPTDTIDKIDFEKTAGIARLVFTTAWELANRNDRIVVDVVNEFK